MSLHSAAATGDAQEVARLLASGAAVNAVDAAGNSPLHLAAQCGHVSVVQALLAAGAVPDLPGSQGYLPIHKAAWGGHSAVVQLLLRAAPETATRAVGNDGAPSLRCAAMSGDYRTVELLIAAAPQMVTTRAPSGMLPVHMACATSHVAAASLLLAAAPETALDSPADKCSGPFRLGMLFLQACQAERPRNIHARLSIVRLMLPLVPPDVSLPALASRKSDHALLLYPTLVAAWPLTPAQWQQVPSPCPGLAAALPAVLSRSDAEAASLVAHLPATNRARLRTAALALHRSQRCWDVSLPADLTRRILASFDG